MCVSEDASIKGSGVTALGESYLYYGCRKHELDFLFEKDLQRFLENKTLTHLSTAYSMNTGQKMYVRTQ